MRLCHFLSLIRKSIAAWIDDYASSMGAAIAYYTLFSIAPLLIIVIAVGGAVFGPEAVEGEIVAQLSGLIGVEGAMGVQGLIRSASQPVHGTVATMISIAFLYIGATSVFSELQNALNRIWRSPATQNRTGLWNLLRIRVLSFGLILGLGFLMLVSLVISAALAALSYWANRILPAWEVVLQIINVMVSWGITTLLFAMIYKLMPQAKIAWRDVWLGALVTSALFEVGKIAIGLYVGTSSLTSAYAAAGSLVVLLVWVYYSAQIFLLGAEFTWVFANDRIARESAGE
ncbi:MAG TPA: YihY/virulence factor BrkB family protein [Rhodocyclaceae bacterium]|jgi:membrane protein|nr:YihY/virulence factor BrkB family protein [Rhodocyclaceae bacterium]